MLGGLVVGLLAIGAVSGTVLSRHPGYHDLEATVTQLKTAPGAAHPLRVDHWGSTHCWLPMAGDCPSSDLLFDSGATSPQQYRLQWEAALGDDGWRSHRDSHLGDEADAIWWTRDNAALILITEEDGFFGPQFAWES